MGFSGKTCSINSFTPAAFDAQVLSPLGRRLAIIAPVGLFSLKVFCELPKALTTCLIPVLAAVIFSPVSAFIICSRSLSDSTCDLIKRKAYRCQTHQVYAVGKKS